MRDLISSLIIKQKIKDPRISTLITVTDVIVSSDLSYAKVYISSFENQRKQDVTVEALNHAAGFIQKNVSKDLKMRVTPKLKFYSDNSIERGFELNNKINQLDLNSDEK